MGLSGVRGLVLEEVVLHLLRLVGYRPVSAGDEGTRKGAAGLEVQGRGEWHQADAFASFDRTPAFMYPLRLVVEAKCYARTSPVGLPVVRNMVGVLKDLSENYFSFRPNGAKDTVQAIRFNYHAALFSTSGYTEPAQRYAIAHQVFLIQYDRVGLMEPVVEGLLGIEKRHLQQDERTGASHGLREWLRGLVGGGPEATERPALLTDEGAAHLMEAVLVPLRAIGGSYFGTLGGKWPMHLLSQKPLAANLFAASDRVKCRLYGRDSARWAFVPSGIHEGDPGWFKLEFDLPDRIAEIVAAMGRDAIAVANAKKQYFPFLDLAGLIGGVRRNIRLEVDEQWLEAYIEMTRRRTRR